MQKVLDAIGLARKPWNRTRKSGSEISDNHKTSQRHKVVPQLPHRNYRIYTLAINATVTTCSALGRHQKITTEIEIESELQDNTIEEGPICTTTSTKPRLRMSTERLEPRGAIRDIMIRK